AWLQAEQRQPNAWQHRAVAYQAYQGDRQYNAKKTTFLVAIALLDMAMIGTAPAPSCCRGTA
ncbi:hypothetical protein O5202_26410, partial [Escherichia coli]|nr:hypothetical protein [Escherichia coli]